MELDRGQRILISCDYLDEDLGHFSAPRFEGKKNDRGEITNTPTFEQVQMEKAATLLAKALLKTPPQLLSATLALVSQGLHNQAKKADQDEDQRALNLNFSGMYARLLGEALKQVPDEPVYSRRKRVA